MERQQKKAEEEILFPPGEANISSKATHPMPVHTHQVSAWTFICLDSSRGQTGGSDRVWLWCLLDELHGPQSAPTELLKS